MWLHTSLDGSQDLCQSWHLLLLTGFSRRLIYAADLCLRLDRQMGIETRGRGCCCAHETSASRKKEPFRPAQNASGSRTERNSLLERHILPFGQPPTAIAMGHSGSI